MNPIDADLVERVGRLRPEEAARIVDLVATRMTATSSDPRWTMIQSSARFLFAPPKGDETLVRVLDVVQRITGISQEAILARSRPDPVVLARHIVMVCLRELTNGSLSYVGSLVGGRDHGTVLNAQTALRSRYLSLPEDRRMIDQVRVELGLPKWELPAPAHTLQSRSYSTLNTPRP